jgi:flagellar basal-body rod protein FlgF
MDKAIYLAMTGGKHIARAQTVHANNMANASTTGFKADFAQARAMQVFYGDGLPSRVYALSENPATDFSYGSLLETGNDLDIAVDGDGWIAVQGRDGRESYIRTASLRVDANGLLTTASGELVLGDGGPIALPPYEKVEIGDDGTISLQAQGQAPNTLAEVGRIRLVRPDERTLIKGEDGRLRQPDGSPPLPADATVRLSKGFLESSNVNVVSEFTQIIALARQFEMNLKVMRAAEENSTAATRLLQQS